MGVLFKNPFQDINALKGEATREKIAGHWKLFRKLWKTLKPLGDIVVRQGGILAIEWPNKCKFWHERDVRNYVSRHGLCTACVHGCEYGMRSVVHPDKFLHKIWHIKCSNKEFAEKIQIRCGGKHEHCHIEGRDTELSGRYPERFARGIVNAAKTILAGG